jgi:hypothetical protein
VEVRGVKDGVGFDALIGGLAGDGFFGWEGRVLFRLDCSIEGFQVHAGCGRDAYLFCVKIGGNGE